MRTIPNIKKLYALRFFQNLIPAYVIERLYWEHRGMSVQEVVYTEIIYALTIVFLEIPTGILADKWSRRNMLVVSALLGCMEFLILLVASEFWHFAIVVFLAGIAGSSASGAENALLYDSLLQADETESFERYVGRLNALDSLSVILAALSGSWLAGRYDLELNYWISLSAASLALLISLQLKEPIGRSGKEDSTDSRDYVRASLGFFRTNPAVCLILLSAIITGTLLSFHDEFWQLHLDSLKVPVVYFGLVSAAMFLLRLPGQLFVQALLKRYSSRRLLAAVSAVFGAGFVYIAAVHNLSSLGAVAVLCLFSGIMEPLAAGSLHHRIDSSMRATVDSFQSLAFNGMLIVFGLGFGYFSDRISLFAGYGFLGTACTIWLIVFLWLSGKRIQL